MSIGDKKAVCRDAKWMEKLICYVNKDTGGGIHNEEETFEAFIKARERLNRGLSVLARREGAPAQICDDTYADMLMELMLLVLEGNAKINLTTITEPEEFAELHLLDSLACVGQPELEAAVNIVDVGSGSGFPALPLALLYPEKQFLLTDSLRKRMEFAAFAAEQLALGNIKTLHTRAETAGQDPSLRGRFDLALCRAVGKLPLILEYTLPFVRTGGAGIFYKTIRAAEEIEDSLLARQLLGGSAEVRTETYGDLLPGREHALYVVGKERTTPKCYPRREGLPEKAPL